jgi:hypothetical protein
MSLLEVPMGERIKIVKPLGLEGLKLIQALFIHSPLDLIKAHDLWLKGDDKGAAEVIEESQKKHRDRVWGGSGE